jgi:SpoIID/LytB domain protein
VGLSAEGARYFAEQGWDWQTILKYYYTGVEIEEGY